MQALTNANCPTARGTAFDARNNQIYYVQKIPNSGGQGVDLCWMETNLRYAGDGNWQSSWGWTDDRYATSTSNSTLNPNDNSRALTLVSSGVGSYKAAEYINPGGDTNYQNTSAVGGFYGYLYNLCAAMGGQYISCSDIEWTQPSTTTTICPAGWRLPAGGINGGEFAALNTAINGSNTESDSGLRSGFLAVYSGLYGLSLTYLGQGGNIWSSTSSSSFETATYALIFDSGGVLPGTSSYGKGYGLAIRCVR
jgi:uncharacterized protein (TIGR02145 family)